MTIISITPSPQISQIDKKQLKISNSVRWGDEREWKLELCFEFDGEPLPLTDELDPWLVLVLLPAMRAGMDLELSRPVSARLLRNLPTIQTILNTWDASYKKIKVTAPCRVAAAGSVAGKSACFL